MRQEDTHTPSVRYQIPAGRSAGPTRKDRAASNLALAGSQGQGPFLPTPPAVDDGDFEFMGARVADRLMVSPVFEPI